MQIWTLLTRSQCRVSDNQVTFKALESLVSFNLLTFLSGYTKVQYFINVPNVDSYPKKDLENLRKTLVILLSANYNDVIVCGVKNGCVIVIFMISDSLIPCLRTLFKSEENIFQMLKEKIFKIMIHDDILFSLGMVCHNTLKINAFKSNC